MDHVVTDEKLDQTVIEKLGQDLDPSLVKFNTFDRTKPDYEYLDRDSAITQANDIFGFDGWSYRIVGPVSFTRTPDRIDKDGNPVPQGFYSAIVSLYVRGVGTRDGIGTWHIASDNRSSHDTAVAGAVTQALKRGLLTFGAQFGLELRSTTGVRQSGRQNYSGSGAASSAPAHKGAARIAKEWVDAQSDMTIPKACELMSIRSFSDGDITQFMTARKIENPEELPSALDEALAQKAA